MDTAVPAYNRMVFDLECFSNFFSATFVDYDSDDKLVFEISERQNDITNLVMFMGQPRTLIGFNSLHYDNLLMNYLWKNHARLSDVDYKQITAELKKLNDKIIEDEGADKNTIRNYTYNLPYKSIDLFKYWSLLTVRSRKLSLKSIAVNINWPRIQELPHKPSYIVQLGDIDAILDYNLNDVLVTKAVTFKMKDNINLRIAAEKEYGFDCMSWDDVKLGYNILLKRYCDRTGLDIKQVKEMRTRRPSIDIGSIILPIVKFKEADDNSRIFTEEKKIVTEFKSFYGLHQYLKTLTVTDTKQVNCRVSYKGNRYDVKSGGLHTYHNPGVIKRQKGKRYRDVDVTSWYPTLGALWQLTPEHLGEEFAQELDSIRLTRVALKAEGKGKSPQANLLKLAMNGGFYGNTNNEWTAMYDPQAMMSITINGQLLLLMLCEQLIDIGVEIDMCNTDGVTIIYDEALESQVNNICKAWEILTRAELEAVEYTTVVRMNINNYLAGYEVKKGDYFETGYKLKGQFLIDPALDMSRDFLVVSKAIHAYYTEDIDIEDFINNHDNIYDFCACQKVSKDYYVTWNNQVQQRLNRYYVTKGGAYLYKNKAERTDNMLKGFTVELFNDYTEASMETRNINYQFYIAKTKEILVQLEPQQASLF